MFLMSEVPLYPVITPPLEGILPGSRVALRAERVLSVEYMGTCASLITKRLILGPYSTL